MTELFYIPLYNIHVPIKIYESFSYLFDKVIFPSSTQIRLIDLSLNLVVLESIDITEHQASHMIFTLHVYQYRIDKTGRGGGKEN